MFNLITIGDALVDTHVFIDNATLECDINQQNCQLCLNYASKIPITHSFQSLGGNAANVALGTSRLNLKTAILSSIGNDASGSMIREELIKQKIDTSLLSVDKKIPTRYSVVLNFKQERTILSYHQKRSYPFPKKFPATDWIYYSSLSEGYEDFQEKLLVFLNKHPHISLSYNPGSIQLQNLDLVKKVIARTNILILNLEEAKTILSLDIKKEESIKYLIQGLLSLGAQEVAITDSKQGAWAGNTTHIWHCAGIPVEVVSKTGAGDAFSSGYLAARFYKKNIDTALNWGILSSTHIISSASSKKIPLNKKEMARAITKFPSPKPLLVS
ncbi:MAG: carbohydrate kinase family protein [Candidatus Magasanikbacteria bacterium]|nr:carbohydrate kinase family protein [Candidatus Magasanikbacteria bacterium]